MHPTGVLFFFFPTAFQYNSFMYIYFFYYTSEYTFNDVGVGVGSIADEWGGGGGHGLVGGMIGRKKSIKFAACVYILYIYIMFTELNLSLELQIKSGRRMTDFGDHKTNLLLFGDQKRNISASPSTLSVIDSFRLILLSPRVAFLVSTDVR